MPSQNSPETFDAPFGVRRQVEGLAALHPEVSLSALLLALAVYRTYAVLDRNLAAGLTAVRLTTTQFNILMTLDLASGPVTMGELASMLVVQPTNLSGIVGALAGRGLVQRKVSRTDKRSFNAVLTAAGRKLLARYLPSHSRHLETLTGALSEKDRINLAKLLRGLVRSVQAAEAAASANAIPRKAAGKSKTRRRSAA